MAAQLQKHSEANYQIDSKTLTLRQKRFVYYYVQTLNATKAARLAGYAGNDVTLASVGYENLKKPQIVAEINRLCNPIADAEEVLQRLTKHSRARISDVLTEAGEFDLQTAKDVLHSLRIRRSQPWSRLASAQIAACFACPGDPLKPICRRVAECERK